MKTYVALLLGLTALTPVWAADERPASNEIKAPAVQAQGVAPATPAPAPAAQAQAVAPAAPPAPAVAAAQPPTTPVAPAQQTAAAPAPAVAGPQHWSYIPVVAPAVPDVQQKDWVRQPLDAFVLAKIEAKGLKPAPDADRATFIRRATLDVWGLLPSPEEVAAFVEDQSPNAYEKLADRLLASPHYGERQARRWLDLARYADSAGFQGDQTRPNYYRYRDYVIYSFNQDKPFSRFIQEQLAGDELFPNNQEALTATGFLTGYPDNPNSRDLVDRKFQITTDMTDTVGAVFLGTTLGCARCHNHKSDKISQKDYYSFQSFFANTSTTEDIAALKGFAEEAYEKQETAYKAATKDLEAQRRAVIEPILEKALKYHKERYLTDSRESIFKPEKDWNALDRWVNHRLHNANVTNDDLVAGAYLRYTAEDKQSPDYSPDIVARWEKYKKLTEDLKQFDKLKPKSGSDTITGVSELGHQDSPPTHILFGGNHERPLDEVQPAFPAAMSSDPANVVPTETSSGRRTALANWLASASNPLTARVFVNRVWAQYFTRGIVGTVSDFGKAGERPTNQPLLDYLADAFVKNGWSVKSLQRSILLSSTYRQSSDYRPEVAKEDPDNKLVAVFPRQRLEAEEVRDALLVASGRLTDQVGGPSVFPPVPANLGAGQLWQVSADKKDWYRRSLYVFTRRSVPYPLLEAFNAPNTQQVHSAREVSTTALQALSLINNEQVFELSQSIAGRVIREAGKDETAQINRLYQILFSRNPDDFEKATLLSFLDSHEKVLDEKANNGRFLVATPIGLKRDEPINPIRAAAFVDLVHAVVNSNDFVYRF
ncbi:MAG: DUF1549 and DUF1553 domain-containing protein [Beijerinckiaceae bacterium]|nr:DUF1549 and DUF1553 domain-containing protein [Beijerinckiaceae bacterium]